MQWGIASLVLALLVSGCTELGGGSDESRQGRGAGGPTAEAQSPDNGDLVREIRATRSLGNFDPDPEDEVRITIAGTDDGHARQTFAARIDYELQEYYGYYPPRWDTMSSWSGHVEPQDFEDGAFTYLLQHDSFERVNNCNYRVEVHVTFDKTGYTYDAATDCFY